MPIFSHFTISEIRTVHPTYGMSHTQLAKWQPRNDKAEQGDSLLRGTALSAKGPRCRCQQQPQESHPTTTAKTHALTASSTLIPLDLSQLLPFSAHILDLKVETQRG